MAYNKAKAEKEWVEWKNNEEKQLRELGVDEDTIQRLHSYDWKAFKAERNYRYWNLEQDSISEVAADDPPEIVQNVEQLMDCIEDERLYKVLKETDGQTLQILMYRMKGYSIKEIEQIMSVDDAAIKMRISRLRKKLKNIF